MKTHLKYLALTLVALLGFSCSDEDADEFQAQVNLQPVALEIDINRIELDQSNVDNPAISINWQDADYNVPTAITYNVEMASVNDFSDAVNLGVVTNTSNNLTLSVNNLNKKASELKLPPFQWSDAFIRVTSSIGTTSSLSATSNVVAVELYPYFTYPFKDLYLVGNATEADWNNNNENPLLFRDSQNSDLYSYTGRFLGGDMAFKNLEIRGQWQPQWGTNNPITNPDGSISGSVEVNNGDSDDPGVFSVPQEGYYTFTIDLNALTFNINAFDEASAPNYTQVSIVGDATASEVQLEQSTFDPHIWSILSTDLLSGTLQFNLDGTLVGGTTEFSGTTEEGAFTPVPVADAYEIWFNDLTGKYGMIPINLSN